MREVDIQPESSAPVPRRGAREERPRRDEKFDRSRRLGNNGGPVGVTEE